ncbi:MAG: TRAP transporter small permease subunit [Gammaproteobacteria bacterium]|nr:MAG: TRAP transporter small permease subunit [Gammaproteobacteria bacterium]
MKNINQTFQYVLTIFPRFLGILSSWAVFLMIVLTTLVVIFRYFLGIGVVGLQEMVIYLHGIAFLFCSAYAYENDEHVRVDIFYRRSSMKNKKLINLIGNLIFLQPMAWTIFILSLDYVSFSWSIYEISPEPGGLPFVYLYKSSILIFSFILIMQSLSLIFSYFDND